MPRSIIVFLASSFLAVAASAEEHPGAKVYKAKTCATCHGADGSGNTPAGKSTKARDLRSAEVQKRSDDDLAAAIVEGQGNMPAFRGLSPQQVKDLVGFIRSLAQ